ncbi:glycoside hydrolase family 9 protein [Ruminococcus sp.]|uniref:glycoside hydrolase family 9 protein n=1 Tax=Ruminococcus sp. TaxID=41978 RepID=UPI001B60F83C|nr:glycoside hydrolase family 9 protein [Ruminococcus sp.]MBP5430688.1 glycoside hydrolase family 9 protein [Ruminococcus sp.]
MMNHKKLIAAVTSIVTAATSFCFTVSPTLAADEEAEQEFCAPISEIVQDSGLDIDYARALQYSLYFYDANMCGDTVDEDSRLSWRGNCHTYDAHVPMITWDKQTNKTSKGGTNLSESFMTKYKDVLDPDGDGTIDVAGGFHDAGDHVEFGMPENYSAATLGWDYYEFRDVFKKLGQDDHMETILRHFNDYLMKCTFRDKDGTVIAHCYQVGDGNIDHAIWNSPEVDTMPRPAFFLTAEKPQTDYVVSACASLAINYLNFKDTDAEYAEKSLDYAKALWNFANDNEKELSDNADGPGAFYGSTKWEDDYCWAAAWMYLATGDDSVFDYAVEIFDYYAPSGWCYCWNDMWSGAGVMWAAINQQNPELDLVQRIRDAQGKNQYVFDDFWDDDCVGKCLKTWKQLETKGGFAYLNQWGSCRYNTAMQMICLVYDKYKNNGQPSEWSEWAKKQMDYVLGQNDVTYKENSKQTVLAGRNGTHGPRAFIVGYNDTAVKNPHHRAASGLLMAEDPREQKHILWGALAGGPDGSDGHSDSTNDWVENEVTIDYNACLPGAAAGLYALYGTPEMAVTPNFPPEDEKRVYGSGSGDGGGSGYWVEAVGVDKPNLNGDGSGTTQVSFKVLSGESNPSKKISVRYFFNIEEMAKGIDGLGEVRELYDQSSTEDGEVGADGVLTGPFKYDKVANTYYVEITWDGYVIANSGKKYQFDLGMYYGDIWDPSNDWSYQDLKIGKSEDFFAVDDPPEKRTDYICIYDDGVLVGGIEPDGTTAEEKPKETTTTKPKTITTTTTSKTTTTTTTSTTSTTSKTTTTTVSDTKTTTSTTVTTSNEPENMNDATRVTLAGDVNCDGTVDMADAVLIMQSLANPNKYGIGGTSDKCLTEQGAANGDVDTSVAGLTSNDALKIQEFLLGKVKAL